MAVAALGKFAPTAVQVAEEIFKPEEKEESQQGENGNKEKDTEIL